MQIKRRSHAQIPSIQGLPETLARILANRGVDNDSQIDYGLKRLLPPHG